MVGTKEIARIFRVKTGKRELVTSEAYSKTFQLIMRCKLIQSVKEVKHYLNRTQSDKNNY